MTDRSQPPRAVERDGALVYSVAALLPAPPEAVWQKLTDPEALLRWDSMLLELEGRIEAGGTVRLRSALSPKQVFTLQVSEFVPNRLMVWRSGRGPLFRGVRTYRLEPNGGGTLFRMEEVFSGWLLPLMKRMLPDCDTLFGTYVRDLQSELARTTDTPG